MDEKIEARQVTGALSTETRRSSNPKPFVRARAHTIFEEADDFVNDLLRQCASNTSP